MKFLLADRPWRHTAHTLKNIAHWMIIVHILHKTQYIKYLTSKTHGNSWKLHELSSMIFQAITCCMWDLNQVYWMIFQTINILYEKTINTSKEKHSNPQTACKPSSDYSRSYLHTTPWCWWFQVEDEMSCQSRWRTPKRLWCWRCRCSPQQSICPRYHNHEQMSVEYPNNKTPE